MLGRGGAEWSKFVGPRVSTMVWSLPGGPAAPEQASSRLTEHRRRRKTIGCSHGKGHSGEGRRLRRGKRDVRAREAAR